MNEERSLTVREQSQEHEMIEPMDIATDMRYSGRALAMYAIGLGTVAFLGVIAWGLYLVHQYLVYIGYLALAVAGIGLACLGALPVIALLKWFFHARAHTITNNGLVFRTIFGHVQTVAPQAPRDYGRATGKNKETAPQVTMLSLFEMIEQGIIAPGARTVVHGYELNGLDLAIGERLPTRLIAGKGRSGKSRRAIFDISQDLIAGAHITVCDPHGAGGKRDALAKVLAPLRPWVTFAVTPEEIARVTNGHIEEMRRRLDKKSEEIAGYDNDGGIMYKPRVIYYDEWSELMTRHGDDLAELLITCLEDCSRAFGGVGGYATIIGQTWTANDCGGTVIRRCIHDLFIHNLSPEYAKFLLPGKTRMSNRADELPQKNCLFKPGNSSEKVREIITPFVSNDAPAKLADIMKGLYPIDTPEQVAPRELPAQKMIYNPEDVMSYNRGLREQVAQLPAPMNNSSSYEDAQTSYPELDRERVNEQVNTMNALQNGDAPPEAFMNGKQVDGETFTLHMNDRAPVPQDATYTREQERDILLTAFTIARENGNLTRKAIMERLNWTRAQWGIIKAVCDKHNIAA